MSFSTSLVYYTKKLTEAFSHWEEQRPQKRSSASWPPEGGHRAAASEAIQHVLCVKDKTLWSFIHFFWIHISIMHFIALYKKRFKYVSLFQESLYIAFFVMDPNPSWKLLMLWSWYQYSSLLLLHWLPYLIFTTLKVFQICTVSTLG